MRKNIFTVTVIALVVTLMAWGATQYRNIAIVNSTINSTTIGQSSPAAAVFTTATATTSMTSPSFFGNATTATSLQGAPTQCSGGQFSTGVNNFGNANCNTIPSYNPSVSYSDVTGGRFYSGTYTNTSGGRIRVLWTGFDSGGSHSLGIHCYVDGSLVSSTSLGASTAGDRFTVACDVAQGSSYTVTTDSGGGKTAATIASVFEEAF